MGERGPKPRPTALKILQGEREDRINRYEPIPDEGAVTAPDWLSERALEVWNYLAPRLIPKGCLTVWDVNTFAVFCNATAIYRECAILLETQPSVVGKYIDKGGSGGVIKSPYWQIMRDCAETMAKYSSRFGLTPGDRAALQVNPDKPVGTKTGAARILG